MSQPGHHPITRRSLMRSAGALIGATGIHALPGIPGLQNERPTGHHHRPRARALLHVHLAGGPSQLDLYDPKPELARRDGEPCPDYLLEGKRFAFLKGRPVLMGSPYSFRQHGESGTWMSDLLPHLSTQVDRLAFIRSMRGEEFNHTPAQLLLHSGSPRFGRPGIGAWLDWALGTGNPDLPGYVVMVSGGQVPSAGASLWSAGFLPSVHQGVEVRGTGDPVLYLNDPPGSGATDRRRLLDALGDLNRTAHSVHHDPETLTRTHQYELAHRMQTAVPETLDLGTEKSDTLARYGITRDRDSFARNCLMARRLIESGVRIVQLYDWGWDHHGSNLQEDIRHHLPAKCQTVDRPLAALLEDMANRGLLEETLVLCTGEFGRTPMRENRNQSGFVGRDHQPDAFTVWLAGAGIAGGTSLGETDDRGGRVSSRPVEIFDLQATVMHLFGFDHERLTYAFQGRDFRLTDVAGHLVDDILA